MSVDPPPLDVSQPMPSLSFQPAGALQDAPDEAVTLPEQQGRYSLARLCAQAQADVARLRSRQPAAFASSRQHLQAELEWVRRLLTRLIYLRFAEGGLDTGGLSVPDREIATFLGWDEPQLDPLPLLDEAIAIERRLLDQGIELSHQGGIELALPALAEIWGLDELERQIITVLLAPELSPAFGRAFCYAWNDFQRKLPGFGFIAELLGLGDPERAHAVVQRLLPSGRLHRARLTAIGALPDGQDLPLLARTVQLATRVVLHLLGQDRPDERLGDVCRLIEPELTVEGLVMPQALLDRVCSILLHGRSAAGLCRMLLSGPPGTGKKALAGAFCRELGRRLLVLDVGRLWERPEALSEQLRRAFRETSLQNAVPYLELGEGVPQDAVPWWVASSVGEAINDYPGRVILGCVERPLWLLPCIDNLQEVTVPFPGAEDRFRLWERFLPQKSYLAKALDLKEIAHQFVLSGGGIRRAAEDALERARRRSRNKPHIRFADLVEVCSAQIQHRLSTLAHRVAAGFSWEDMILEQETLSALQEMLAFARHKRFIFQEWGFRSKVPYGAGLSCLFSGPPGTGKTMAASIIARELGMELFRIDLSRVVNKYIGETEKNLGRIFDEARESNAVLLFDEADSLFSKRTDVRSSVDRYANLEVNYLLQRMEDHDGVTLLTTNMEASLDEAFKRRLKFRIHFPFPDARTRARLWQIMMPRQAALEPDIDWTKLGAEFELSGGHIKNAVLRAAVLAASAGKSIAMEHLRQAGLQEYREMGKLVLS